MRRKTSRRRKPDKPVASGIDSVSDEGDDVGAYGRKVGRLGGVAPCRREKSVGYRSATVGVVHHIVVAF